MFVFQRQRLNKIEDVFQNKDHKMASIEAEPLLLETLDFVTSAAGKYIDIASNYNLESDPVLDQQRLRMCLKEMELARFVSQNIVRNQSRRKIFQKLEKIYTKIEAIVDIVTNFYVYPRR